eukprot:36877-Eustigmatos_ZCMA.PRE.1
MYGDVDIVGRKGDRHNSSMDRRAGRSRGRTPGSMYTRDSSGMLLRSNCLKQLVHILTRRVSTPRSIVRSVVAVFRSCANVSVQLSPTSGYSSGSSTRAQSDASGR